MKLSDITLKDVLTALVALPILGLTLLFLWQLYAAASQSFPQTDDRLASYQRMKDVIQILLPFATTAAGVYLGKITSASEVYKAEKNASEAKANAKEAREQAAKDKSESDEKTQKVKRLAAEALTLSLGTSESGAIGGKRGGAGGVDEKLLAIQKQLMEL